MCLPRIHYRDILQSVSAEIKLAVVTYATHYLVVMEARLTASTCRARPFTSYNQTTPARQRKGVTVQALTQQSSPVTTCISCVLAGAVAVPLVLWPPESAALTPYEESKRMVYGPTADGSIRGCPSNINPNCVSTASINDSYSPAWRAFGRSPADSADVLESAVENSVDGSQLIRRLTLQSGAEYRAFSAPSLFGEDVVEFIIRPESVTDRNWEGDQPGQLVTYRSMAGSVKYIWPIQQPLSDFDAQRKRLQLIRTSLGWQIIGCELLECYQ